MSIVHSRALAKIRKWISIYEYIIYSISLFFTAVNLSHGNIIYSHRNIGLPRVCENTRGVNTVYYFILYGESLAPTLGGQMHRYLSSPWKWKKKKKKEFQPHRHTTRRLPVANTVHSLLKIERMDNRSLHPDTFHLSPGRERRENRTARIWNRNAREKHVGWRYHREKSHFSQRLARNESR